MTVAAALAATAPQITPAAADAHSAQSERVLSSLLAYAGLGPEAGETAASLLARFGTLGAVMHAPAEVLKREFRLPFNVVAVMGAVLAVHRAALREELPRRLKIDSGDALRTFLHGELRHRREEALLGLFLDNDFQLIEVEELAVGSVNRCPVTVRQIVERALAHGASAVILAHNHPSGRVAPSDEDVDLTRTLQTTLANLDVELVEHVIVGDGTYSMLSQQSWA
jgi:DNA repair protein RadC